MMDASKDPLLRATRLFLTLLLALAALVTAGAAATAVGIAFRNRDFAERMASAGIEPSGVWWVVALAGLVALMAVLSFLFLRHLRRIVDSVAGGDPFVPDNAERLRRMAWLTLGFQAAAVPMTRLAVWFDAAPLHPNVYHGTDGFSAAALILTFVLFILARVLRHGAAMRDELEGTV